MILLTGGAGYIGSHTAVSLLENNHDVVIVDNLKNSSLTSINNIKDITGKSFPFFKVDLRDKVELKKVFLNHDIEAVIHFAGLKSISESNNIPIEYFDNNVGGFLSLINLMEMCKVKKIVFSSSATVYGLPKKLPIKENENLSTLNAYGSSKLMIENILNEIYKSDPMWNVSILRYFNPVGAHESGLIGENPLNDPTNLFPIISLVAAGKKEYLEIYGDDYSTKDGTGVRDYIHVCDLSNGHLAAIQNFKNEGSKHTINLGTGKGHSVLEIVKEFEIVSGNKIPYKICKRRIGDSSESYADVSYAKKLMGWSANRSLRKMCEDQWRWQKQLIHRKLM